MRVKTANDALRVRGFIASRAEELLNVHVTGASEGANV
jgi:hypothetical protein